MTDGLGDRHRLKRVQDGPCPMTMQPLNWLCDANQLWCLQQLSRVYGALLIKGDFAAIEETEFLQNQIVPRIVARGWTFCESHLLWLYFGIHQPSKSEFLRFNHRQ